MWPAPRVLYNLLDKYIKSGVSRFPHGSHHVFCFCRNDGRLCFLGGIRTVNIFGVHATFSACSESTDSDTTQAMNQRVSLSFMSSDVVLCFKTKSGKLVPMRYCIGCTKVSNSLKPPNTAKVLESWGA